ncbi:MAG: 3-hydroxyacyl-CoA dehydrogenase family protein [Armatimonadota bacterium]
MEPREAIGTVGIIGAGTMGAGIAQVFLGAGYPVCLHDQDAERSEFAVEKIRAGLERWEAKGKLASAAGTLERLEACADLAPLHGCDLVVEAIVEDPGAKEDLLRALGRLCKPETILASNTSSNSITRLGAATGRPERTLGLHFFNPAPVMRLVEVVSGLRTDPEVLSLAERLVRTLEKTPVRSADRPGFLSNRILMPLLNEAFHVLEEGVGTAEDIDRTFKLGMGHPMGPLELADLIGLDVCLAILQVLHGELGDPRFHPAPILKKYVEAGWLGRKNGRGFFEYPAA